MYPLFIRLFNFVVILLSSLYFKMSISVKCVFGKAFPLCYKLSPLNCFLCQTDVFLISCTLICSFLEFFLVLLKFFLESHCLCPIVVFSPNTFRIAKRKRKVQDRGDYIPRSLSFPRSHVQLSANPALGCLGPWHL